MANCETVKINVFEHILSHVFKWFATVVCCELQCRIHQLFKNGPVHKQYNKACFESFANHISLRLANRHWTSMPSGVIPTIKYFYFNKYVCKA